MDMGSTQMSNDVTKGAPTVEMKLEVIVIPVSDVDRAKRFYGGLGWRFDADFANGETFRVVHSRLRVPQPPSISAKASRRPHRARHKHFTSSSPISRRRAPSSSLAAPM